jgi:hypothetical protein
MCLFWGQCCARAWSAWSASKGFGRAARVSGRPWCHGGSNQRMPPVPGQHNRGVKGQEECSGGRKALVW